MRLKPFKHQADSYMRSRELPYYALLFEPGLGKTKVAIDTACHLFEKGRISRLLVLAPAGVYGLWVDEQFPTHLWVDVPATITKWVGTKAPASMTKAVQELATTPATALAVLVMNVEAIATERGFKAAKYFVESGPCLVVVDESTAIKNSSAQRTKAAYKLGQLAAYRRILNGTPITQSPLDLFGQYQFLQPGCLGTNNYFAFRGMYARMITQRMGQRAFQKVIGFQNLDFLHKKMDKCSFRATKAECLDLPPKVYLRRQVELTPEQKRLYEQMRKDAVATLRDGKLVVATVAMHIILRLQQLLSGIARLEDGTEESIPSRRADEVLAAIAEAPGKVLVWSRFVPEVEGISTALAKEYGADSVVKYYGHTTADERGDALQRFRHDDACRFFVATAATGGLGLTLVEADTMVFASNSFSMAERVQAEDRAHRVGQTKTVTIIDIVAPGTVDERILAALRAKKELSAAVLAEEIGDWLAPIKG